MTSPARQYNGDGWYWKPVSLFLMGAILSGALMVAREHIMLRDFVTKAEAREIVNNAPFATIEEIQAMIDRAPYPYIEDRKYMRTSIVDIKSRITKLENKIDELIQDMGYVKKKLE